MRPVRLAAIALVAATMAACSNDITAPSTTSAVRSAPSHFEECRTGYLTSTGRCE